MRRRGAGRRKLLNRIHQDDACDFFAVEHTSNSTHNSAQWPRSFFIGKEYFAGAMCAVVPAFEDGEVFHVVDGACALRSGERLNGFFDPGFHGSGFSDWLNAEMNRAAQVAFREMKQGDGMRLSAGLDDDGGEPVNSADNFGQLADERF